MNALEVWKLFYVQRECPDLLQENSMKIFLLRVTVRCCKPVTKYCSTSGPWTTPVEKTLKHYIERIPLLLFSVTSLVGVSDYLYYRNRSCTSVQVKVLYS
jgi:hypothetical protein